MKKLLQKMLSLTLAAVLALTMVTPALASPVNGARAGSAQRVSLPAQDWQGEVAFPDWQDYVDDTLAMNSLYSFTCFSGQGELYVTPAAGVEGFRLFVNNAEVDTSAMEAGSTWRVDISDITVDGTNTIQVSAITPADIEDAVTVRVPYPTVIDGTPESVGMDQSTIDMIGDLINAEVKYGFSGAQLAVIKDGRLVVSEAWGAANGYRSDSSRIEPGDEDYVPVTTETLYDLASNTKMYSVNYALQYMLSHEGYDIGLDDPITKFFPAFDDKGKTIFKEGTSAEDQAQIYAWKSQLTVRDILMHQAGFDPDPQYHNDQFNQATQTPEAGVDNPLFSQNRETTLEMVLASPLTYEPGSKTVYSDVDYMLLCFILEKVTGQGLDEFLKEKFWEPMGLTHITYNPLENGFEPSDCAATELNGNSRDGWIDFSNIREGVIQGAVHDEKAYYAMEGVSGHAGLFSNAEDLAKLASLMLTGGYEGVKYFDNNVMDDFTKPKSTDYPTWGLGWYRAGGDSETQRYWLFSPHSSVDTIGHQGWTGTLTMIDPENNLVVVVLTNKKNSPLQDPAQSAHSNFYGDDMVLGSLGVVTELVYDSFTSTPDAMDAYVSQLSRERTVLLDGVKGTFKEVSFMNDAFALAELTVLRAEQRQSQVTVDNARQALAELKDYVAKFVDGSYTSETSLQNFNANNVTNAAEWMSQLESRVDAIQVTSDNAPAAPVMTAVSVSSIPGLNGEGEVTGGVQNTVAFPGWDGRSRSDCGYASTTWAQTYEGQGTVYAYVYTAMPTLQIFINGHEVDTSAMLNTTGAFAIDISKYAVNGRSTIQVTGMPIETGRQQGVRIVTVNPTVISGKPADVGIDTKALDLIADIIQADVDRGFTSAQLAVVKDGRMVYSNAWGAANSYHSDGARIQPGDADYVPATRDTLYDLASNTKMYAVNYALQYLVAQGEIGLRDKIVDYFPNFAEKDNIAFKTNFNDRPITDADKDLIVSWKQQLTIQDILQHQAGFDPDPQFHNDQFNQDTQTPEAGVENPLYAIGSEAVADAICRAPLNYEPGTKTVYSDVDYMLLGLIIEQVTGKDLDTYLKETFYTPLGLSHITYSPLDHGFTADDCAATELNGNSRDGAISFTGIREGVIQGTVHDEKAYYAMGGVSGHAGLYANAEDLAKLAQVMLNHSGYGETKLFNPNVNSYFTSRKDTSATYGQGWRRQGDCQYAWYFGVQASRDTIGHTGWTGTLTVIDPAADLVVVYLTNKINSPVTDITVPNTFDGNWYTASTLGFVANILYQGLAENSAATDIRPALDALLGDMSIDALRLVDADITDSGHPVVQSAYAMIDLLSDMAEARPSDENTAALRTAMNGLDAVRDREMIAALRAQLGESAIVNPYSDIKEGDPFYDAILLGTEKGLFTGVPGAAFAPNEELSRAMLAMVLYRDAEMPAAENVSLADVNGRWFASAAKWAVANGVIPAENGAFNPDGRVTPEQLTEILTRYGGNGEAAAQAVAEYAGHDAVTRGEAAAILTALLLQQ